MEYLIYEKMDLVQYILEKYRNEYNKKISPIKLQKSLYFLFAMWGGKVRAAKDSCENDIDDKVLYGEFHDHLFDAKFEAWKYGPVDSEVWKKYKYLGESEFANESKLVFNGSSDYEEEVAKQYIDELLIRIFCSSDFGLVDLSHEDRCWKDAYVNPNHKMDNEKIIEEYSMR